ncbi:MAG: carbohydrate-binding family 9-like protein [Flavobacteriaceae bacterium]
MKHESLKQKRIVSLIFFLIYLGCALLMAQTEPLKYIAYKTSKPILIDGKADELSWELAPWSEDFIDIKGVKTPLYKTNVKMLWDDDYFYFFAELKEPHVWGTLKQRDTVIFYNNDFEIFIDPDGDTHDYMEFEMNALNTLWDLFLTKPYRNHPKVLDSWDIQGIKTAVHIDGSLNDASDIDEGWSVEIALPWKVLVEANVHNKIPENEFWRVNFSRVNWNFDLDQGTYSRKKDAAGNFLPEFNWVWSPQGVINMHEPEKWGYVLFSPDLTGEEKDFTFPRDEHLKWYLYELYRDLRDEKKRKVIWKKNEGENVFTGPERIFFGQAVKPKLEKLEDEFSLWVRSPFSNEKLVVKNDGKFKNYASQ